MFTHNMKIYVNILFINVQEWAIFLANVWETINLYTTYLRNAQNTNNNQ